MPLFTTLSNIPVSLSGVEGSLSGVEGSLSGVEGSLPCAWRIEVVGDG